MLLCSVAVAAAENGSLRGAARAALKAAADAGETQHFRLLVIPVDFADRRFDATTDWNEVGARLAGEGESLERYYDIASGGRMELRTVLAPPVHLDGARRDYSDLDLGGDSERSRAMATEALTATAAHVPFARIDCDGPDGIPGSGDDDGFVDGVLILHAAPGLENDPDDGLIIPLQYYLPEPVVRLGVAARSYAVASLHSGLGMWLHESAHLLGLEDRYDLYLSAADDARADVGWGGLGMFSLMGAGHLGTGDGSGAALLDAYSAAQLGWVTPTPLHGDSYGDAAAPANPAAAAAWRLEVPGSEGREYFLLETRRDAAPFDAALPPGGLLIYHVDENVPEDGQSTSNPLDRHLRVRLVEADGDRDVALALSLGEPDDLFPSDGVLGSWTPATSPSSDGYGAPTGAAFRDIRGNAGVVTAAWNVPGLSARLTAEVVPQAAFPSSYVFAIDAEILGEPPLSLRLRCSNPAGGSFAGAEEVVVELAPTTEPHHWSPQTDVPWTSDEGEPGTVWSADLRLEADGAVIYDHRWSMSVAAAVPPLDFDAVDFWERWTTGSEGTATTVWKRWRAVGGIAPAGDRVMAVTRDDALPDHWPGVTYDNRSDAWLLSPPFRPGAGLTLRHHLDTADTEGGADPDGAVVEAVLFDGTVVPLTPVLGYPGRIAGWSSGSLRGREAFVGAGELLPDDRPYWDVASFDTSALQGADIRLRFRFASDALWRGRGWFLKSLTLTDTPSGFQIERLADGWHPRWPETDVDQTAPTRRLEAREGGTDSWLEVAIDATAPVIGHAELVTALGGGAVYRELRLVEDVSGRLFRSRAAAFVASAPSAAFDSALTVWPNPAKAGASLQLRLASAVQDGVVEAYDLRGRRVMSWNVGPGVRVLAWDGRTESGRLLPAGRYLLRLTTSDITANGSLTLIP